MPGGKKPPAKKDNAVFRLDMPQGPALCIIADSPHSGTVYPGDFGYACDLHELRKAEDSHVDKLYDFLPSLGIPFLQAKVARSYVDTNRRDRITARYKKDGDGPYVPAQMGILRDKCTPRSEQQVYDRPLRLKEVFNRVARYHKPYHTRLKKLANATRDAQGRVVHLNCHSMPSRLRKGTVENPHDVILGTRGGTTCAPEMTQKLKELFAQKGYRVGIDVPGFSGAEIVRRNGNPKERRHSIQIELNRKLYMDEETLDLLPEAQKLKADLKDIVADFAQWCEGNIPAAQNSPASKAQKPPAP
ncbi:MAG: N-formylglutamate amidohydrolase [Alphaproteobacteria bacterium]|nr:N-formylglutamate amidohydrolase [Alphaproteobacteria bacterium]